MSPQKKLCQTKFLNLPNLNSIGIFFALLCGMSRSMAQTSVIVNEEDDTKYSFNSFVGFTIKPNAFKDGNYLFYTDSTKANLIFEGSIVNGKTNGYYYAYSLNRDGYIRPETKTAYHSKDGNFDGICKVDATLNRLVVNKYLFKFDNGEIKQLKVINPFFRFFFDERDQAEPVDTLTFQFQNGKLQSLTFFNQNNYYSIIPPLNKDILDDPTGIEKLAPAENYFMYSYENRDSSQIAYFKNFKFIETGNNRNNRITLVYDTLKTFKSLNLISEFPWVYNPYNDWHEDTTDYPVKLMELRFNTNKNLQSIEGKKLLNEQIVRREDVDERMLEMNNFILFFRQEGILDTEK